MSMSRSIDRPTFKQGFISGYTKLEAFLLFRTWHQTLLSRLIFFDELMHSLVEPLMSFRDLDILASRPFALMPIRLREDLVPACLEDLALRASTWVTTTPGSFRTDRTFVSDQSAPSMWLPLSDYLRLKQSLGTRCSYQIVKKVRWAIFCLVFLWLIFRCKIHEIGLFSLCPELFFESLISVELSFSHFFS